MAAASLSFSRSAISPVLLLPHRRLSHPPSSTLRCRLSDDDSSSSSSRDEPTESLFMKELKRRGMVNRTPRVEEESNSSSGGGNRKSSFGLGVEMEMEGGSSKRNGVASADYEVNLANQRERSMALNSEGLEGLIPRAKLLLSLGGTFFLGFGPLILITIASFSALYILIVHKQHSSLTALQSTTLGCLWFLRLEQYLGPSFVHGANKSSLSPPTYVDPYALLEDDTISQVAPRVK